MQAGRVRVGHVASRFRDRELRAIPVGIPGVACEQHAEFVHAGDDLRADDPAHRLRHPAAALEFERRQHRVVTGVVDEHHRRPVLEFRPLAQRQVVGDREDLVVRHQQALVAAG